MSQLTKAPGPAAQLLKLVNSSAASTWELVNSSAASTWELVSSSAASAWELVGSFTASASITRDDVQDGLFLLLLAAFVYVSMFAFGGVEL
jgi:hypothetical protein